jgi:hypothetical protein
MRAKGAVRGDRVAVMLPNGADALALILGMAKAGLVWVPVNTSLVGEGLRYILTHSAPRLVVVAPALHAVVRDCGVVPLAPEDLHAPPGTRFAEAEPAPEDDVAIAEALLNQQGVKRHAVFDGGRRDVFFAKKPQHHGENKKAEEEVYGYTAEHDDEPLPGRFGAKLPGLRRLFERLGVHAFVYHTGYFDITTQGQPAYAVLRFANLGFPKGVERGEVKKQVKFFNADFKPTSG